jgi:energy-coupling factor transporter transmembrane protein EcfT
MRELLRFYLFHKDSTARRSRNSAAASLVFFVIAGCGFTALLLGAWIFRSFEPMWLSLLILFLALGTTAICWLLFPRALRVHRVLEKYKDPVLFKIELFRNQDQDVAEALIFDSFGRTTLAVNKLKVAIALNPRNVQASHLLNMIEERDNVRNT